MLFAMPSVRAKLGLSARPASDPDLKAKRLVQGDQYLQSVLYGSVDTMAARYGIKKTAVVAATPKSPPKAAPPKPSPKANPASPPPKAVAQKTSPPPVVKPQLVVPESPSEKPKAETSSDGLLSILVPPVFKKKAKLVIPQGQPVAATAEAKPRADPSPVLALPKDLQIGRMGDSVKNLKVLETLPGYVKGGPVSPDLSPYKIAGSAWKSPDTYYYLRGKITPGDKVDEKSIEIGTLIFYRAPVQ